MVDSLKARLMRAFDNLHEIDQTALVTQAEEWIKMYANQPKPKPQPAWKVKTFVPLDSISTLQFAGGWFIKHPHVEGWVYSEMDGAFVMLKNGKLPVNPKALQFPNEIEAIEYGRLHLLKGGK